MWKLNLLLLLGLCFAIGCNAAPDAPTLWDNIAQPAVCSPYLTGKVVAAYNPSGTFAESITNVELGATLLAGAGPSCQTVAISALCKFFFAEFNTTTLTPVPACATNCELTLEYCMQALVLGGLTSPPAPFNDSCSALSGWGTPPNCVAPINTALLPPSFANETFSIDNAAGGNTTLRHLLHPVYTACDPFWSGQRIFVTDATPQRLLALAALAKIGPLQDAKANAGLTHACYDATIELVCKTAFLKPFWIPAALTPGGVVDFYLPHPPCKSVCNIQNSQCAQTFLLANQLENLVNCSGPFPSIPTLEQYPTTGWSFLGGSLTLPCTEVVDANPEPTFRCEAYNTSLSGSICAPFITYPFWVPPATDATVAQFKGTPTQHALAKYIAPLLSAASALPPYCQKTQIEFICKSAYQKCSITPNIPVQANPLVLVNFTFGGPPCRSLCDTNNDQCAQILSLSGNDKSITYCDSKSPATGLDSYPQTGYSFGANIFVPCAESVVPRQPAPFSCEKFDGKPSVCSKYIDYEIMVTPQFDQKYLEKQVSKSLKGTEALPDGCREPLEELACKTGFRKCDTQSLGGVTFNWGRRPCKKVCDTTVGQCGALFVLAGQEKNIPDCKAKDANDGQRTYPKDNLEYHAFGKTMKVKCVDLDGNYKSPPVRCTKYKGTADFCKKYINVDSVFENDLLPQETASSVVEQFNQLMLEASSTCRDYALNLACNVLFQECDDKSGDDFDLVLPKPPCRSACTDMPPGCKDYFKFYRIPVPDCSEKDPLTAQPRYPKSSWEFKFDKKKYETDCRKRSDAKAKIPSS